MNQPTDKRGEVMMSERLARQIRDALAEFNDDSEPVTVLVENLARSRRHADTKVVDHQTGQIAIAPSATEAIDLAHGEIPPEHYSEVGKRNWRIAYWQDRALKAEAACKNWFDQANADSAAPSHGAPIYDQNTGEVAGEEYIPSHEGTSGANWKAAAESMEKHAESLQAKIDALMLEYCPEDMTPEQVEEWGRHQRAATPEQEVQIETARSSTGTPLPQENETYWAYQYSDGSWWTDNIFNTREQGERFATGRDRDLVEDATLVEVMIRRTDGGSAG